MRAKTSYFYKKSFVDFNMDGMHTHEPNNFEIMYVKEGNCNVCTESEEFSLSAGDFILLGNCCPHSLSAQSADILNIEFFMGEGDVSVDSVFATYPDLKEILSQRALLLHDRSEVYAALDSYISELRENGEGLCASLLFCRLLIELARSYERRSVGSVLYVQKACDYIKERFCERLTVAQIADEIGINRAYLQTLFHRVTGKTIIEYINSLRIDKACFIMKNTGLPVIDIAIDCGFASRQHFMYIFKKQTGCTARQYRKGRENYERD